MDEKTFLEQKHFLEKKVAETKFEKSFGLRRLELGSIRPQIIRVLIELVLFAWWYVCKRQNVWHVDSNYIV